MYAVCGVHHAIYATNIYSTDTDFATTVKRTRRLHRRKNANGETGIQVRVEEQEAKIDMLNFFEKAVLGIRFRKQALPITHG